MVGWIPLVAREWARFASAPISRQYLASRSIYADVRFHPRPLAPHDSIIYVVPPKVNGALSILARQTADGSEGVRITYDGGLHVVSESKNPLGQAASALHTDGGVPLPPGTAGKWTLRVFIDKSIVEAHLNARRSITSRFYPQDLAVGTGAFGLKLHNAAPNATMLVDSVEVWGMRGIY